MCNQKFSGHMSLRFSTLGSPSKPSKQTSTPSLQQSYRLLLDPVSEELRLACANGKLGDLGAETWQRLNRHYQRNGR